MALLYSAGDPNSGSVAFTVSSHCVGQTKPSATLGKSFTILADSQCAMPTSGTSILCSPIWRAAVAAPFSWPDTSSTSGFNAFTLVRNVVMSLRSLGMRSSITVFMLSFLISSATPLTDVQRERVVLVDHRDLDARGILAGLLGAFSRHVDHRSQVLLRRGDDAEVVFVALREERARGGLGLHHGDLVLLGDRQNRLCHRRAVRPEHEFDVVLVDQALDELGRASRCRLVVVVFDRQMVALAADLDAAGLIDLLDGEIVAVLGVGAVRGVDAGGRQGRTEDQLLVVP